MITYYIHKLAESDIYRIMRNQSRVHQPQIINGKPPSKAFPCYGFIGRKRFLVQYEYKLVISYFYFQIFHICHFNKSASPEGETDGYI